MGREKMFDPAFQKAFTEAILKENKIRLKWNLDHGLLSERVPETCSWIDEPDDDDEDFIPESPPEDTLPLQETESGMLPPDKHKILKQNDLEMKEAESLPPVMKPIPIAIKRLLYRGISREGEGKSRYLTERYKKDPEDKFYFPITSSWEYGWTYGEPGQELKCPDYGRKNIIRDSFFRRNDPQLKPRD